MALMGGEKVGIGGEKKKTLGCLDEEGEQQETKEL
jgi:hypothetical protein